MTETRDVLPAEDELAVLQCGTLDLRGRIRPASNLTFLAEATLDGVVLPCVYKPVSGERPLWDFPEGTLAGREVAAFAVSEALGWSVVPLTVMRSGPAGTGMVQLWREPDRTASPVDVVPEGRVPASYRHVLDAYDERDRPVSLVHEDTEALRRMAVFDVVVNNADRKGGHVLAMPDGHRYGVDHGVCFNLDDKLRTVLWGWADEGVRRSHAGAVRRLAEDLADPRSGLAVRLRTMVTHDEVAMTMSRCRRLLRSGRMPSPSGRWPAIPWPAF
jgi:uncharacterized repeat protein (TIGR03843 family)